MKRGLIPAIISVFLPTYLLVYIWSEEGATLVVVGAIGMFWAVTTYSSTASSGENTTGTAFAFFDPNWYLDLREYMTSFSYSDDFEQQLAEVYNNWMIRAAYGNLRDVSDGADLALGFSGMLFGLFILLLISGIVLGLMEQEKNSGIVFFIATAAAVGAMLFAWDGLQAAIPSDQGSAFPIPIAIFLVLFAGFRAYFAPEAGVPRRTRQPRTARPPAQVATQQYCMHCGEPLLPPGKFCPKCGKTQT
ncbi:MAG: zinc ribbon domain-containing protein [Candidatus Thorarchaeota archaeon]